MTIFRAVWHVFIAGILAPYLVCLTYLEWRPWSLVREPLYLKVISPLVMMLFGLPVVFLFVLLGFPALLAIAKIRDYQKRRLWTCLAGTVLGALVGIWILSWGTFSPSGLSLLLATVCIGFFCAYLDSLAWADQKEGTDLARPSERAPIQPGESEITNSDDSHEGA